MAQSAFPIAEPLRDDYRVRMFIEYRSLHIQRSMPQEVIAHFGRLIAHKHLQAQMLETAMTAVTEQELTCGIAQWWFSMGNLMIQENPGE